MQKLIWCSGARYWLFVLLMVCLQSCKIYNQNVLFRTKTEIYAEKAAAAIKAAERNYVIKPNDFITFNVFSNKGEILVEPPVPIGAVEGMQNAAGAMGVGQQGQNPVRYLIQGDGSVDLPLLGNTLLAGYTLHQADSLLATKYNEFFKECFVTTNYSNKRVIVFVGATARVIPLVNENINLVEVLALAGGLPNNVRARNIRLIRGDLKDPNVYLINLSTIEGMRQANLKIEPNDIVYIEPIRKTFLESLQDLSPILSFATTIFTLIILLRR